MFTNKAVPLPEKFDVRLWWDVVHESIHMSAKFHHNLMYINETTRGKGGWGGAANRPSPGLFNAKKPGAIRVKSR